MKNPLVDALRQASQDSSDDETENHRHDGDDNDRKWNEGAKSTVPEDLDTPETETVQREHNTEPPESSWNLDLAVEEPSPDVTTGETETTRIALVAVSGARRASLNIVAAIGRLSPVLCLIAVTLSASGYVLINRLVGVHLSENLGEVSERIRTTEGITAKAPGLPVTGISVFESFGNRQIEQKDLSNPNLSSAKKKATTWRPPSGILGDTIPRVDIDVSDAGTTDFSDRAYDFVVTAYEAYHNRDYDAAEKNYLDALAVESNHRDALAGIAAVYLKTGRKDQAVFANERLLSVDPGNTTAAAAIVSLRSDEVALSIESDLKHLLQRFPDTAHLHFELGTYYVGQEKWPDAKFEFLAALKLAPRNADYSYNIAVCMERMGEQDIARHYYKLALEIADKNSGVDQPAVSAHLDFLATQYPERL